MKTERNILIAFILNFAFSIFELIGGAITGSVAIMSDAVHEIGDAASIGISYFLERKSKKQPDKTHTFGYLRYSVIGGVITTIILLVGSIGVIINAIAKIIGGNHEINYDGMIIFAIIGVLVNLAAAFFTREGDSINQKAVNLHMLEDVLGWAVVLVGAIVMRVANGVVDLSIIDPLMSIGISIFIFVNAITNLKEVVNLFLAKLPEGFDIDEIKEHVTHIDGVVGVHHIHIWSMDGQNNYATLHVVVNGNHKEIKEKVREELKEYGIGHTTLELENEGEECGEEHCHVEYKESSGHHHHHHHHHHGHKYDHHHGHGHHKHNHEHKCDCEHHGHHH